MPIFPRLWPTATAVFTVGIALSFTGIDGFALAIVCFLALWPVDWFLRSRGI